MKILLTGYTGNLGSEIVKRLAEHHLYALVRDPQNVPVFDNVEVIQGDFNHLPFALSHEIEIVLHAAANTTFRAPLAELRKTNVEGTIRLLEFAQRCPKLHKFVHVSTACVCGTMEGEIPEAPLLRANAFVNSYEESKWKAEQWISSTRLPVEIVRLSTVAGSEENGSVKRLGALHHMLFWLWKGLIPMMPGTAQTSVDLISTEYAANVVAACVESPLQQHRILHGCAGKDAPRLGELLDHLAETFSELSSAWAKGSIAPPAIVDAETFTMFEASVKQSGDVLFQRICEDSSSFLPGLLHPRIFRTEQVDAVCSAPRADWKKLTQLVTRHVIQSRS